MKNKELLEHIITVGEAFREILDRVVFIGGFASFLYHYESNTETPLFTFDLDTLMGKSIPPNFSIRKSIENLGFVELPARSFGKSCGVFINEKWKNKGEYFKIELLLPQKGKDEEWGTIEPGLEAQKLRYLDLLQDNMHSILIKKELSVNIPHPARYLLQKLLAYDKRNSLPEKEKDSAYIVDLINLYFNNIKDLFIPEIVGIAKDYSNYPEKRYWCKRAIEKYKALFENINSEGVEYAARQIPWLSKNQISTQAGLFIAAIRNIL